VDSIDSRITMLETKADEYAKVFVTTEEFEALLNRLPMDFSPIIDAMSIQIDTDTGLGTMSFGQAHNGAPAYANKFELAAQPRSSCSIQIWGEWDSSLDKARFEKVLTGLVSSFWKGQIRDALTGLPLLQAAGAEEIMDNSLSRFLHRNHIMSVFFLDIDNFKAVNDQRGHTHGDRVIKEFGALLNSSMGSAGITARRSTGADEFVCILPCASVTEALLRAWRITQDMRKHDFNLGGITIGVSIGIAVHDSQQNVPSIRTLEENAERAINPSPGIKDRGKARLSGEPVTGDFREINDRWLNAQFCVFKSNLTEAEPFSNPWLNLVSRHVFASLHAWQPEQVRNAVAEVVDWIQPQWHLSGLRVSNMSLCSVDFSPNFSPIDVATSVAHGVFRTALLNSFDLAGKAMEIRFGRDGGQCQLILMPDDLILFETGGAVEGTPTAFNLGEFFSAASPGSLGQLDSRVSMLVKIGHHPLDLPDSIFAEIMVVDDRPAQGGGLPDFWEATIARLIARVEANPNIASLFVFGNHAYGSQTIKKLETLNTWLADSEEIIYKTGMSLRSIGLAVDRLQGKISFPSETTQMASELADVLRKSRELQPGQKSRIRSEGQRFLNFELNTERIALNREDGCRLGTIREAYPVVLEIARRATSGGVIRDQAGLELRELVDFKVHLTNPNQNLIPAFYSKDEGSLNRYFEAQFLSDAGLFGERLQKSGQLDAVIEHISTAINDEFRKFATRRAILIIPHETKPGSDLAPLGLVSIRIFPRFIESRILLHFSYTWRTVEALVGFPYSLYGSVRYSSFLTDKIRSKLKPDIGRRLEMGEVSYIAHSLHIFMDDYAQNIARKIIDDASL